MRPPVASVPASQRSSRARSSGSSKCTVTASRVTALGAITVQRRQFGDVRSAGPTVRGWHGDFDVVLEDDTPPKLSRHYRDRVLTAFGPPDAR